MAIAPESPKIRKPKIRKQLNGAKGEATNSDDVKGKGLAKQISSLRRLVERDLSVKGKKRKQHKKSPQKRSSRTVPTLSGPPVGGNAQINAATPMQASFLAPFAPFDIPRGIASQLTDAKPSQKFTARALGQLNVGPNETGLLLISPCIANDPTFLSGFAMIGTMANLAAATSCVTSTAVMDGWPNLNMMTLNTNTPYSATTLAGADFTWRLVSAGLRLRNTTAQLNRGGVIRYNIDANNTLVPITTGPRRDWATGNSIVNAINSSHKSVRYNCASTPDVEIAIPAFNKDWNRVSSGSMADAAYWSEGVEGNCRVGGTTSLNVGGIGRAYVTYTNPTSATQLFDIELIEHWEVHGTSLETLHSTSASHAGAADLVQNLAQTALHQHSLSPHVHFKDVVKGVANLEHNKKAMQDVGIAATCLSML